MITDHIAILTHSALAQPVTNQKKASKPSEFYAVLAFPPTAADDLQTELKRMAPGGSLTGLRVSVRRNEKLDKPIPGIPSDWFIIRGATRFPPYLADEGGNQLSQETQQADIRVKFYPGKRVRAALSAYHWANDGGGLSFNLNGVMAVSDGERLNIGNTAASAFAGYVDPNVAAAAPAQAASPFGASASNGHGAQANASADPFQQAAKPAAATTNPFA
jgi:Protein of unknown function (DUF2815)